MAKAGSMAFLLCSVFYLVSIGQPDRWQQYIKYGINVQLDVTTNRFSGTEQIDYWNNSPDTLNRIFFHLYWNAFQPNSSMDVRSRELGKTSFGTDRQGNPILDWDSRVKDRISKLTDDQIGYQHVQSIKINGVEQKLIGHETILEVKLSKPILPKSKVSFDLVFEAQVPIQIRRSGRDNAEGIRYSMSQWYPKMVEYDYQGWNANPYIAREFYGVWGDYDVKITLDKTYMVAATGMLQNPNAIGFGYEDNGTKVPAIKSNTITWNFKGENIHDFVWAADPDYIHLSKKIGDVVLNAFYKKGTKQTDSLWNNVLWSAEKVLPFIEKRFGKYPYPQYSFIQGGDGGMEYAMATLLRGPGLGGVFHEWMHNWYQHLLGTNESLFAWMDEGFTTYAEGEVTSYYNNNWAAVSPYTSNTTKAKIAAKNEKEKNSLPLRHAESYASYFDLASSPYEEPLTTHADHFNTNFGYSDAAYNKGSVFLSQLGYIVGDSVLDVILHEYYNQWRFKHPNANDFVRIAEKVSGMALQWYKEYWVYSTKTIDYAIGNIDLVNNKTQVTLKRIGKMPMPIDVLLTFKDGTQELHYIPLSLMYGAKPAENNLPRTVEQEWKWTNPEYQFTTNRSITELKSIEIDPTKRLAELNGNNNKLVVPN
ncbi:M1 family metallopeptidase [Parasediminibacterium sp. JCM 36343]|uniref:M1 family metallopeptidase n=1 Tax=Parasediminibacterium sp. JCM 36343 TaxID=3374279 RepID=UPI0039794710